jgi:hypothetical protein
MKLGKNSQCSSCMQRIMQSIMQRIGAIPKSPNRYQQLSIIAFAICVSVRYGIIDYPTQRYGKETKVSAKWGGNVV